MATTVQSGSPCAKAWMVAIGGANDSSASTTMRAGFTILAQVTAAGQRDEVPATSSSSEASIAWTGARLSSFCPTRRTLRTEVTRLSPRSHNPPGGHPGDALTGQFDLEPIRALADDFELGTVRNLVDDA